MEQAMEEGKILRLGCNSFEQGLLLSTSLYLSLNTPTLVRCTAKFLLYFILDLLLFL